jgi:carbon storage regulator CsrA
MGLVLTRKTNETIQIGNDVTVRIVSQGGGKCRVEIVAPKAVKVLRGELLKGAA